MTLIIGNNDSGIFPFYYSLSYDQNGNIHLIGDYDTNLEGKQVFISI
jgi:hypothetical protein